MGPPATAELSAKSSSRLAECKVLLVEDERIILEILERAIDDIGVHRCTAVRTAEEAWARLTGPKATYFHVLITDLTLPGASGKQLLAQMRQSPLVYLQQLPVLVITGSSDLPTFKAIEPFGISGFLIKPVSRDLIRSGLERALESPAKPSQSVLPAPTQPVLASNKRRPT